MVNKLCNVCARSCKQSDSSKIVSCPKFLKKPTDSEFRDMLQELDEAEQYAKKLQKNVREIIKNKLAEQTPEPRDSVKTKSDTEPDKTDAPNHSNDSDDSNNDE